MEIISIIVAIIIIICVGLLYAEFRHIQADAKHLEKRVEKLEQSARQRMPFRSYDEILDAMAALDALEHEENFKRDLIQNAKAHLTNSMTVGTKRE